MALKPVTAPGGGRPFAAWRIVVWLVMLLSGAALVLNAFAVFMVSQAWLTLSPEAIANGPDPRVTLAWSVGYAVVAFITVALSLGTLRWREWGRAGLRIVALLLAAWAVYTAWVGYDQWRQIGVVLSQPGLPPLWLAQAERRRTILLVGVILKAITVPTLAWLSWRLGSLRVREQFGQVAI
ncbi:hypothetical protein P3W24_00200 [Luteibacter sp. PPL201]|uniref:Uncharacterized protein n=1 Tax=Luteibacter sahnii TaxID=3021977 RepID=A0ABT6B5R4_9GAMM